MGPLFVSTANHTPPIPHLSCLLAISYPYEFQLGAGKVIKGWEVALKTMNVGDSVELVLGPAYAYGEAGSPGATKAETIPPNATLKFHVDFIAIMVRRFPGTTRPFSSSLLLFFFLVCAVPSLYPPPLSLNARPFSFAP